MRRTGTVRWMVWTLAAGVALAAPEPVAPQVDVPEEARALALPLDGPTLDALRARDAAAAVEALARLPVQGLHGDQVADLAFVRAWELVRADRAAEAVRLLDAVGAAPTPPPAHRALLQGELLRAAGRAVDALPSLASVPEDSAVWARAQVVRAEVLRELGRTADAAAVHRALVARPDPAPGSAVALLALARRSEPGGEEGEAWLRRLWAAYPGTPEARTATELLTARQPGWVPTDSERLQRARARMEDGAYDEAVELLAPLAGRVGDGSVLGCQVAYVLGRSHVKRNRLSKGLEVLEPTLEACAGVAEGEGEKSAYLAGHAAFRRKDHDRSERAYAALAVHHAASTYADDGLTRAGIAALEQGAEDRALRYWAEALERFPDGDTVPEAAFRLAFTRYEQGRTDEALEVVDRLATWDQALDEVHVPAARYWAARWRALPDVAAPRTLTSDASRLAEAKARWTLLAAELPHHVYGALAWARLASLDPATTPSATRPVAPLHPAWRVSEDFLAAADEGLRLARLGLVPEALAAWGGLDLAHAAPEEVALIASARVGAGDWLAAHQALHAWLREHPVGTLGAAQAAIVRLAYPDAWWTEVRQAVAPYAWDPRFLHALSREESTFDPRIVSFAGARGLAQLMPATATEVARRLGREVRTDELFDPLTNLTLGAAYLDRMLARYGGNPCLALAAYNAGPGNTDAWVERFGDRPLDELIERIPFRETRGYVKRVTGTWQTMRFAFDQERPPYVELGPWLDRVVPEGVR
ncbi:MAG: transglycosylase SLT domain-containing protein [Alphaproteobacteria bacterium]|nr:transglycosylase SLT domain-containing protein [Alphaproteobacteria bacterium]